MNLRLVAGTLGKRSYIGKTGKVVINRGGESFSEGLAVINEDGKVG